MQPEHGRVTTRRRRLRMLASAAAITVAVGVGLASAAPAQALAGGPAQSGLAQNGGQNGSGDGWGHSRQLAPRTQFTMAPDGSSGATQGGEGIPNIDSVKKTIYTYYGDPGTGIANKESSPYINELNSIVSKATAELKPEYDAAIAKGERPAIVFDADDTTLWTYDMEVGDMHFNYNPAEQDVWVQGQKFPAVPGMVAFANAAAAMGYTVFGLTGRNDDQKAATLGNLAKVGYTAFTADHYFTKWTGNGAPQQPPYGATTS